MTVWELLEIEVSSQNPYIPAYEVETSSRYNQVFFFTVRGTQFTNSIPLIYFKDHATKLMPKILISLFLFSPFPTFFLSVYHH